MSVDDAFKVSPVQPVFASAQEKKEAAEAFDSFYVINIDIVEIGLWLRSGAPCGSVVFSKASFKDPAELGPAQIVPACFIQTSAVSEKRPGRD